MLFTNPANAFRDYDGFQLIGTKRYSHNWQATMSYTWSHARGTADNRGGTNSGGGGTQGLGQNGGFSNPNHAINLDGNMRFDPTNALKLEGTYTWSRRWVDSTSARCTGTRPASPGAA